MSKHAGEYHCDYTDDNGNVTTETVTLVGINSHVEGWCWFLL